MKYVQKESAKDGMHFQTALARSRDLYSLRPVYMGAQDLYFIEIWIFILFEHVGSRMKVVGGCSGVRLQAFQAPITLT
jgi:hypothetical protein